MSTAAVAAIDLGATSGRVIVGRVAPDTLETTTVARFGNEPVATGDGLHWDVLALYGAASSGLRKAMRAEPGIASVGVDSWAVDYGLLRGGRLLGNPYHYRDERTARGVRATHARADRELLYARNGLQFLPFNTLYQLAADDPDLLGFADTMLLIPDLIAFWLTGVARAEQTNASTTGLYSHGARDWDDVLIDRLRLPRRLFPETIAPGETLGPLAAPVAAAVGAGAGLSVTAVGSHDTASAVVAVPMDAASSVYISCGTWGLVGVEVEQPVLTEAARSANFTNEGGVDGRVRLLHNVMGLWVLTETLRRWEHDGHAVDLSALLAAAKDIAAPLPVFDINDDRFLPGGDMPARIDAWCAEHGLAPPATQAAYVRSIIESLAQAFADIVPVAARLGGVDARTIHLVGGGALNELLCQRTADRSGLPVLAGPVEATALGNILIQARSLGHVTGTLESLRDLVRRTQHPRRYEPRGRDRG